MIIDFHTHTFPLKIAASTLEKLSAVCHVQPYTDGTNDGLLSSMATAGIDCSVVLPVATSPKQVQRINDTASAVNAAGTGVLSFGGIHPDYEDWEAELHRIVELGLPGIKIHPVYHNIDQDDPRYVRILRCAGSLGLIVVTHAGLDIGYPGQTQATPDKIRRALDQAGDVTFVAAHMGGWWNWAEATEMLRDTPVYLDTAFATGIIQRTGDLSPLPLLNPAQFVDMVRAFGADRILFGTDSPWSGQQASLDWLRALPLTDAEQEAILSGNARRLLHI